MPITYRRRTKGLVGLWQWLLIIPVFAAWPFIRFMVLDWDRFAAFDWIVGGWGAVIGEYGVGWPESGFIYLVFIAYLAYWQNSPKRNFLMLDTAGLTYRRMTDVQRNWCWDELSAFALEEGRSGRSHIVFTLPEGQTLPVRGFRISKTSEVRIEDIYDTPLEEIAARLNACREQALGADPGQSASSPLRPATFQNNPSKGVYGALAKLTHILVVLGVLVAGIWLLYETSGLVPGERLSDDSESRLNGALAALIGVAIPGALLLMLQILPNYNYLRLDQDGLTVVRLGQKRRWFWRDLVVDLHPGRGAGYLGRRGLMTFATLRRDWLSRFLRWWYGLSAADPAVVVEDIYAMPLERIAAKLNEYRDRALVADSTQEPQ